MIQSNIGEYRWIENWAKIPDTPGGRENGRTHGVTITKDRRVVVFHQAVPAVLIYDPGGQLLASWGDFPGAHGLTLFEEAGEEFLWLTDEKSSLVVKMSLDGRLMMSLSQPDLPVYLNGQKRYVPTWAAQNPETGEIWVGDGYGASLVHRYSASGIYLQTLDGREGAGSFREPHGLNFVPAPGGPELWITDRANHRIVVYDGDGNFKRSSMTAHSPCCFDSLGDSVLVPELYCGVKVLRRDDLSLLAEFGASDRVSPRPDRWYPPLAPEGWPDLLGTEHIQPGMFNSPHAACFAPNEDIYVVEWIIGGRITKLEKLATG